MKKETRYEPLPKPELEDIKEVLMDGEEFNEPNKAIALSKALSLKVGDTIEEEGDYFIVNPRYELSGSSPQSYKELIDNFKTLLTPLDIVKINNAIKRRIKSYDEKLYNELNKKVHKKFKLLKKDDEIVLFFNSDSITYGISNTIYHLLSKDKEDYLVCYRCAWKGEPIPDQREWTKRDDGEYRVLDDYEADSACDDSLDEEQWKMAVEAGNTYSSYDSWVEEVKNMDGRGNILSGYDNQELEETVNDTDYYIYRTN